ncbi:hypothetical protein ACRRTK_024801 [Alexandromys fortis]
MTKSTTPGNAGSVIKSLEEKMEADASSIYVGNVDYGATAEELEAHVHGCGSVNQVTTVCDKFSDLAKRFAYIEFLLDKESVRTSLALDDSLLKGRQIKDCALGTTEGNAQKAVPGNRALCWLLVSPAVATTTVMSVTPKLGSVCLDDECVSPSLIDLDTIGDAVLSLNFTGVSSAPYGTLSSLENTTKYFQVDNCGTL